MPENEIDESKQIKRSERLLLKLDIEMENKSNISLLREKCMKCGEESDILMRSTRPDEIEHCDHKFCQSCFRKKNTSLEMNAYPTFKCPCCHFLFYANILTIDEAILIGEALTIGAYLFPQSKLSEDVIADENIAYTNEIILVLIDKLESALMLNPTNFNTLFLLFSVCSHSDNFLIKHGEGHSPLDYDRSKSLNYSFRLLDHPAISAHDGIVRAECCYVIAGIFNEYNNYPAALKYSKLAYESCLRSSEQENLSDYKAEYLQSRANFAKMPPLRFGLGDEVEFLHELETGSEGKWKLGLVAELYYRERAFAISFSAPYRLQLLDDSDSTDQPPVYAWVKADLDRYVRKVGVRSIEDTRYQARLDAKVAELEQVYCSVEFIQDIYPILAQDHEFVEMLQSVWQIELSEHMLSLYRIYVMYREPLVRTNTGYHLLSSEEIIAGIKAYFDTAHLSGNSAPSAVGDSQRLRADIMGLLQGATRFTTTDFADDDIQGHLLQSIRHFIDISNRVESTAGLNDGSGFAITSDVSDAISKMSALKDLQIFDSPTKRSNLEPLLNAWMELHECLDNPDAGPSCECPYVYFFVLICLEEGWGVPKLALAVYDRMTMQLSREFIRCANPTCELNKLDRSTGKVKFQKCSRCKTVIYCSRECQIAHYPEHKSMCRERAANRIGS